MAREPVRLPETPNTSPEINQQVECTVFKKHYITGKQLQISHNYYTQILKLI